MHSWANAHHTGRWPVAVCQSRAQPRLPPETDWAELLRAKDSANGRRDGEYQSRDLALMLRAMTERLSELGYPFIKPMPRLAEIYAKELREVRNRFSFRVREIGGGGSY